MIYAPIIIPTLNRYQHLIECIESLQRNYEAQYTELFIGLDFPSKNSHWEGYFKIKEYLKYKISGFRSVYIYERETNLGPEENINDLLFHVKEKYDRYILTEDDNIFSPFFLEYMNNMLEKCKYDEDIIAICGYSYPVNWIDLDGHGIIKEQSFFSAWGYGTFFSKVTKIKKISPQYLYSKIQDGTVRQLSKKSRKNYFYCINCAWSKNITDNDIGKSIFGLLENKYNIFPVYSLVRNCGWDGSGINCTQNIGFDFSTQILPEKKLFDYHFASTRELGHSLENEKIVNNFFQINRKLYIKTILKHFLLKIKLHFRKY